MRSTDRIETKQGHERRRLRYCIAPEELVDMIMCRPWYARGTWRRKRKRARSFGFTVLSLNFLNRGMSLSSDSNGGQIRRAFSRFKVRSGQIGSSKSLMASTPLNQLSDWGTSEQTYR